jgi:hypothetical protein
MLKKFEIVLLEMDRIRTLAIRMHIESEHLMFGNKYFLKLEVCMLKSADWCNWVHN